MGSPSSAEWGLRIVQPPDGARVSESLTWLSRWLAPLVRRWLPHRWSLQSDLPGSACLQMGHLETKESKEQVRSPVVIRPCVASAPSHDFLRAMDVISKNKPHPYMGVHFNILANIRQNWGGGWGLWGSAQGPGCTRADEIRSSGGGIQESTWLLNFPGKVETGNASRTLTGIWITWECVALQTDSVREEDSRGTDGLSHKVLVAAEAAGQLPTLWVSGPLEEGVSLTGSWSAGLMPGSRSFDHLSTPGFEYSYICFFCTTGRRHTVGAWKTAEHEGARKDLRDSTLCYAFWGRGFKEAGLCSQQLGGILLWAFNTYCLTGGRKEAGFGKKPWSTMTAGRWGHWVVSMVWTVSGCLWWGSHVIAEDLSSITASFNCFSKEQVENKYLLSIYCVPGNRLSALTSNLTECYNPFHIMTWLRFTQGKRIAWKGWTGSQLRSVNASMFKVASISFELPPLTQNLVTDRSLDT